MVRTIEGQNQFITSKGHWFTASSILLKSGKIQNFASADELASLIPCLPDRVLRNSEKAALPGLVRQVGDIPVHVTAPIVKRLAQLELDVNAFLRKHASKFEGLYEKLADDEDLVEWSLESLMPKVFEMSYDSLSPAGLLAIDRFVSQNKHGLVCFSSAAITRGLWARSRKDMRMKDQVIVWARMYQESAAQAALGKDVKEDLRNNPLSAFINKAHRLILRSRKLRSPTTLGLLGPSAESDNNGAVYAVDVGERLTENDKLIIGFIFASSFMSPALVPSQANSICALIFRAIGAYTNLNLGTRVARLLLQELGVISPWSDRVINHYVLRVPGLGLWPYQDRLVASAEASCRDLNMFRDSGKNSRKDWGDTPVYCIDSSETVEIDDGVSVERDTVMPENVWLHVHVANPAAYISPDHPIAIAASNIAASTYTPSRKFRMMPEAFAVTMASLRADRPAMTVSTLIRADGSVAESRVSLSQIHNVVRLTPGAVDSALGHNVREIATMVIGGTRPAHELDEKDQKALEQALPDLRLMQQCLFRRFRRRRDEWPVKERIKRNPSLLGTTTWTSYTEQPHPLSVDKVNHWRGDPIIVVEGNRFPQPNQEPDFTSLVEHAMLQAGESAAKWCREREIPCIFQIATPHPLYPISRLNLLEDTEFRHEPNGRMSSTPGPHWILEMREYMKITSPLRRYTDLVNQWQIQAYLEANSHDLQHVQDSQALHPQSKLPFTKQGIDDVLQTLLAIVPRLKRAGNDSVMHWVLQAFFRAFHFKEAELPEVWDFKIIGPMQRTLGDVLHSTGIVGFLSPFQVLGVLLVSDENWEKDAKRNQYLPVRIEMVDAALDRLLVKAVGPPTYNPTTNQPIHIQSSRKSTGPENSS